jgi:hypothetical protein
MQLAKQLEMDNSEVRPLTEDEWPLWDNLVDESARGTLFHKSYWLQACHKRSVIYGYFKGKELYAGVFLSYKVIFGIKSVGLPELTPYSGILFKDQVGKYISKLSAEKEASQKIVRRLKKDFHLVYFQFSPGEVDLQPFIWEGFTPGIRYTYIICLDQSLEDILKAMSDGTRHNVRKAEKDGISIVESNDFDEIYRLVKMTHDRQGIMPCDESLASDYNTILANKKIRRAFIAKNQDGEPIAMAYIAWDNKRSYYILGGYDSNKSHYGATTLAIWQAIKSSKQELGLKEFDFEGSMVPQIEQFFRGFGGRQTVFYTASWEKPYIKIVLFARHALLSIPSWFRFRKR